MSDVVQEPEKPKPDTDPPIEQLEEERLYASSSLHRLHPRHAAKAASPSAVKHQRARAAVARSIAVRSRLPRTQAQFNQQRLTQR